MSNLRLTPWRVVWLGLLLLGVGTIERVAGVPQAACDLPATLGLLCCLLVLVGIVHE